VEDAPAMAVLHSVKGRRPWGGRQLPTRAARVLPFPTKIFKISKILDCKTSRTFQKVGVYPFSCCGELFSG